MKAIVTHIQVGGGRTYDSLECACRGFLQMLDQSAVPLTKMHFTIKLPNGETNAITIRDEDDQTVAYGDFAGLPNFLDYAKEG